MTTATLDEKTVTPLQAWGLKFDSSTLDPLQLQSLFILAKHADPQTGEVEIGCVAIARAIEAKKTTKKAFQKHLRRVAQAVDALTTAGIIETMRPGVNWTKDRPAKCAKRKIVFKREVAGGK